MTSLAGDAPEGISVLNLSFGQDTGGQQWRLSQAWQRHLPQDRYRSVTRLRTFYPIQHRLDMHQLIRHWWPEADVLHYHNDVRKLERLRHSRLKDWALKPRLLHQHGTHFRSNPEATFEGLKRYPSLLVAATLDLVAIAPDRIRWLPQTHSLEELQKHRKAHADPDTFVIAHAPTNRAIKSTAALIAAVDRMRDLGLKVKLDIIEKVSNVDCLRRKGVADVFVDQLLLGYGNNAIEAWGMGIPVIAGVDPARAPELIHQSIPASTPVLMEETWDGFPFMHSDEENLYRALVQMMNADVRAQWARKGMEHFLRFHEEKQVLERLRPLYLEAING